MQITEEAAAFVFSLMKKQKKYHAIIGYKKNKRCGLSDFRLRFSEVPLDYLVEYHYNLPFYIDEHALPHHFQLHICIEKGQLVLKDTDNLSNHHL